MMVTGARGFLGQHLVHASEDDRWQLFAPPSGALDIRDRARVLDDITTWKPTVVVHLAYRRDDPAVIVDGSRHVAEAAAKAKARLIHLSTDVVFRGRGTAYTETDATDAISDYGRWKADAERAVAAAHPGALLLRTSLLYGTDRQARIQRDVADSLAGRNTMAFFTDEYRCPAHAADVAGAIVRLAAMPDVHGPLHLAGPQLVSRAELAFAFARFLHDDPSHLPLTTLVTSGLYRPGVVALDCSRAESLGLRCRPLDEALR